MRKLAFLLALLLALTAVLTSCGNKKDNLDPETSNTKDEATQEDVLTAKKYVFLPGDYHCVAGKTITSADASVVEVVTSNMVRAVKAGTTTLTATDGTTTVTHTVTVLSLDNVTLGDDYRTVKQSEIDKAFEQELKSFMATYAEYTEITDRKVVQEGDKVSIDYVGKMDGEEFEGGSGSYDLVIGSDSFIDGFEDGLIGKEVDTTVDLALNFPDPYPNNTDLSGKPVVFTVTINSISVPEEYNDAMVKNITGYETTTAFEEYLITTIVTDMMFTKLTENSKVENIPEELKNHYYDVYVEDMFEYLASMGMSVTNKADLLSLMGYTEENFDKMVWESIGSTMEQDYIFYGYCAANNLVLTKEDYDANLAKYLEMYDCESLEVLMENFALNFDDLYESFLYEKVMSDLYAKADIINDTEVAG